ncbi:cytochrome b5 domain-containing protein [Anaerophilus nitritogenes]|uniref:cytochrome b5 domain-containing protein n=1 Tax=Anaerophilus nitritogenes TaxID=2498136 RepID=UPI001FAAF2CE|nr:cytochrome b5 domain-containing protein [Anaerophilus nitritogenes]
MNHNEYIKLKIYESTETINYLQKIDNFVLCIYEKFYYYELLTYETNKLRQLMKYANNMNSQQDNFKNQKEFTIEELSQYDGSNAKPAYVAVNGIVYDLSIEATWGGGTHFGLYAGKDLTNQFMSCHGNKQEILRNLPKVGILRK